MILFLIYKCIYYPPFLGEYILEFMFQFMAILAQRYNLSDLFQHPPFLGWDFLKNSQGEKSKIWLQKI